MSRVWVAFEHRLHAWLKEKGWRDRKFLLAVSGGVDSMAMLASFASVVDAENLAVLHLHHGDCSEKEQLVFRNRAKALVEDFSRSKGLRFFHQQSEAVLSSEEDMREFRYYHLREVRENAGFDFIVLGHHQEDQVESQILHLLRGSGLRGLVGMKEVSDELLRPFLGISKQELCAYVEEKKIPFLADPSNQSEEYLRNWVRNNWLPMLDEARVGLKQSFMNSLRQVSREIQSQEQSRDLNLDSFDLEKGIPRQSFVGATKDEKKGMIYRYLSGLNVLNISQGQIEEILKRLDKGQKELTFKMSHTEWAANAQYIVARKKL